MTDAGNPELPVSRDRFMLVGILAFAALLRIVALDRVPPPINQDEAVHAYDAWCILHTGADHYGTRWPIFFRAFGDYHPGPFVYLLIPLQAIFGLNVWTTRLPGAVLGVAGVWLTYEWCRRVWGPRVAVWAALFLAVAPWHLHVNRLAFEAGACPTLIVLGLLLGQIGWSRLDIAPSSDRRRSPFYCMLCSGIVFGLTAWFYHAMRVFVPLLLVVLAVIFAGQVRARVATLAGRRSAILWITGLCIGLLPLLREASRAPQNVWARANAVMAFPPDTGFVSAAGIVVRNYLRNLSPTYLLLDGDPSAIQSVPGHGQLLWVCAGLAMVGIGNCVRRWRTDRTGRFLIGWVLVAPIPAALADWPTGHALRGIGALPAWQILAAIGAVFVIDAVTKRARPASAAKMATIGLAFAVLVNSTVFVRRFFTQYPVESAKAMQSEWREVFTFLRAHIDGESPVFVTYRGANQVGMIYLFWNRLDPDRLAESNVRIRDWGAFDRIGRVGNVYFPTPIEPAEYANVPIHDKAYVLERPDVAVPGKEIQRFTYPDGTDAVVLYELDVTSRPATTDDSSARP